MGKNIFLGIDLGTTGTKVVVMNSRGKLITSESAEYSILNPKQQFAEQNPDDWWNAVTKMTNNIFREYPELKEKIAAVGIAGQMHTHVYMDENNNVLRNAITWMDQRSQSIVDRINNKEKNKKLIFDITANFLTPTYTAPNIIWVKENQPEIYSKTEKILLAKDYVKFKLTGEMVTDYSDAAGTLLFDTENLKWADELFEIYNIDKSLMPSLAPSASVIAEVSEEAAELTSIPAGTPVINGSADHAATALGAGVTEPGEVAAILGTAGVISVVSDERIGDPDERIFCWNYCLEDKWVNLAPMQTAGAALNWFKNNFDENNEDAFDEYNKNIVEIDEGSNGLIFLPYLMGERSPIWDSDAKGIFFGLRMNHTKYHFVKAIMEGVGFAFKNNLEVMEELGIKIDEMKFLGGGSKSENWMEIMAGVLNKKIKAVVGSETGALGISIMCGLALGIYDSPKQAAELLSSKNKDYYITDMNKNYKENYEKFKKIYFNLQSLF
jgi:xylulokinase